MNHELAAFSDFPDFFVFKLHRHGERSADARAWTEIARVSN
jgi:hypothetical protein